MMCIAYTTIKIWKVFRRLMSLRVKWDISEVAFHHYIERSVFVKTMDECQFRLAVYHNQLNILIIRTMEDDGIFYKNRNQKLTAIVNCFWPTQIFPRTRHIPALSSILIVEIINSMSWTACWICFMAIIFPNFTILAAIALKTTYPIITIQCFKQFYLLSSRSGLKSALPNLQLKASLSLLGSIGVGTSTGDWISSFFSSTDTVNSGIGDWSEKAAVKVRIPKRRIVFIMYKLMTSLIYSASPLNLLLVEIYCL